MNTARAGHFLGLLHRALGPNRGTASHARTGMAPARGVALRAQMTFALHQHHWPETATPFARVAQRLAGRRRLP